LSSRPDHHHRWNAAGYDDQRNGSRKSGEVAWIEDPGFYQARRTFGFAGAIVVPRPVDRKESRLGGVERALT